jgi:hypothetical protein
MPGLDAQLGGAVLDRGADPRDELRAVVLVGVGRALALPEAAERAADDADVRDVDVAVDDERDLVAGELGAQLVGRLAQVLDRLGRVSANSAVSSSSPSASPSRGLGDRRGTAVQRDHALGAAAGPAARDERQFSS